MCKSLANLQVEALLVCQRELHSHRHSVGLVCCVETNYPMGSEVLEAVLMGDIPGDLCTARKVLLGLPGRILLGNATAAAGQQRMSMLGYRACLARQFDCCK